MGQLRRRQRRAEGVRQPVCRIRCRGEQMQLQNHDAIVHAMAAAGAPAPDACTWLRGMKPWIASWDPGHRLKACHSHDRSEEHTSELQSHSDLVCRLLLEKKK